MNYSHYSHLDRVSNFSSAFRRCLFIRFVKNKKWNFT